MDNISDVQAAALFARVRVELPAWAAPSAAVDGRLTHVAAAKPGLCGLKGTGVSSASRMHAQPTIRKPYNFTTRISAIGGGGPGPHPAREPEPV